MRERKIFRFYSTEDNTMWYKNRELLELKISQLRSKLSEDGTFYDGWNFTIYTDSPDFELVWDEAEKLSLKPEIGAYKIEYSKNDFKNADYFLLSIPIFGKEDFTDSFQTKYIEKSKCEDCGKSVLVQDSNLYIDKPLFRNKDIGISSNHEIIVSEKLKDILEDNEMVGIELAIVNHKKEKIKNDFNVYQLIINNLMPKMDSSTSFSFDPMGYCERCKTHGQLLTSLPKYEKKELMCIKDFNLSLEYFGGGMSGYKIVIVTKKIYNLFKEYKIKGCKYEVILTVNN